MHEIILPSGETIKVDNNITIKDIVNKYAGLEKVMAVSIGPNYYELQSKVTNGGKLVFHNANTMVGNQIYRRGISYVFAAAIIDLFGIDIDYRIQPAINYAFYVHFNNKFSLNQEVVNQIKQKMQDIINQNHPFEKQTVYRLDALNYFEKMNRPEKVSLLRYFTNTYVTLYKMHDKYDYFYGKMPYSTGDLTLLELDFVGEHGLLLKFPNVYFQGEEGIIKDNPKIVNTYNDFAKYTKDLGILTTSDLNAYITYKDINELIRIEEGRHNHDLYETCKIIKNNNQNIRLILISGPSSSGKTTTSKKLAVYLKGLGYHVHFLSVDDYFKERLETPKDKFGQFDYDTLSAVDVDLFNKQLVDLFAGKEVQVPRYNFLTGEKEFNDKKVQLTEKSILIVEGLHALNPALTKTIDDSVKYRIYISPFTQLNLDKNNTISSSDIRLLRRIVRDRKYRGNNIAYTINMWPAVRSAEEKYIYQYAANANLILNTALLYEVGALKTLAEAYLHEVTEQQPEYETTKSLLNFLHNFLPFPTEEIPRDSLLREFIGGSCYE